MSWARLDDNFHDHPKVVGLDPAAVGVYVLCLTWAHRNTRRSATPGVVPQHLPARFLGSRAKKMAAALVERGLWEPLDGGWYIHDFADYLPDEKTKAARSEAGKRGAAKRWQTDSNLPSASHDAVTDEPSPSMANDGSHADAHREVLRTSLPTPIPVQPTAAVVAATASLTQRSKVITDAYSTAVAGMCKWPAINAIVMRTIKSEQYTDADIVGALLRMASDRRIVTIDSVRVELEGPPAPRALRSVPSTTDTRVSETLALAAKYREEGQ